MSQPTTYPDPSPPASTADRRERLPVVVDCAPHLLRRVRYALDTLLMACGVVPEYVERAPRSGAWLSYSPRKPAAAPCIALCHCPQAWALFEGDDDIAHCAVIDAVPWPLPQRAAGSTAQAPAFDLLANAFYFLSSWPERRGPHRTRTRGRYAQSVSARLHIAQDPVDRYVELLRAALRARGGAQAARWALRPPWPGAAAFAVVLSHDIDFLPAGRLDILRQGAKSLLRHLVRQRDPRDALAAARGLLRALLSGRDPYGCVPDILARESALGVRSSFQVAVARRHAKDVNYDIGEARTRDYLRAILEAGFDLCLHGSYRSTEQAHWYVEEAMLLARTLARPRGSRQHYLAFEYDTLFRAQEAAGIAYDMSMGFPDRTGPRNGFSHPYFPWCLDEDRPYRVLEIGLQLMDVTLRSYLRRKGAAARESVEALLGELRRKGACTSVVWHPIVFGDARDPGDGALYWWMVERVQALGGVATDGRCIDAHWRSLAADYPGLREALREDGGAAMARPLQTRGAILNI